MTDWDQLREVGHQVSPPAFESLVSTAGKRDRRARTVVLAAICVVAIGGGIGLAVVNDDGGIVQPAPDPTRSVSTPAEEIVLPDGVLPLPEPDGGEEPAILDAGRYHVPLSDTLAFEVDLAQETNANADGLYLISNNVILKVEIAGEEYGVPRHPCKAQHIAHVGPSIDDLVEAIRNQPVYRVSRPEAAEIDGAEGRYLEIRIPAGYDAQRCEGSQVGLPGNPGSTNNVLPGYVGHWWILDVDGQRVVVQQFCGPCEAGAPDRIAERVQSITFTPTS